MDRIKLAALKSGQRSARGNASTSLLTGVSCNEICDCSRIDFRVVVAMAGSGMLSLKKLCTGLIMVKPDLADFAANCAFLVLRFKK